MQSVITVQRRNTFFVLALILLLAGFLRFYHLGTASFWVDELNHVFAGMSLSKGEAPAFPSGVPNERALLFSRFVGWSFSLFGANEATARIPAAIFGLLSVALVFWVGKQWFDARIGLMAAFLLAVSHPAIGWARTCRMYTLFQLLFLLGVFTFHRGFESQPFVIRGRLAGVRNFLASRGVRLPWLLLSGLIFLLAMQVHQLAGLFAATLLVFFLLGTLVAFATGDAKSAMTSKYFIGLACMVLAIGVGLIFFHLADFVRYALHFQPSWAKYARAEDSHYYFWFLTSGEKFPIAAFFLIGALQALLRGQTKALFALLVFAVPFFFHSFVFSYKVNNYLFNVLPFYFLLAAYALVNLYDSEWSTVKTKMTERLRRLGEKRLQMMVTALLLLWIPLTVWFRVAVKIPFIRESGNNGAVTFYDWRDAADFVSSKQQSGDVVLSTLPLTVLYYLGDVDYNLNLAHLDESLKWQTEATDGRHNEFYTGAPSIESVAALQQLMQDKARGWVIVDTYRLERKQYVSKELSQYIKTNLKKVWTDTKHSVVVYHWSTKQKEES